VLTPTPRLVMRESRVGINVLAQQVISRSRAAGFDYWRIVSGVRGLL